MAVSQFHILDAHLWNDVDELHRLENSRRPDEGAIEALKNKIARTIEGQKRERVDVNKILPSQRTPSEAGQYWEPYIINKEFPDAGEEQNPQLPGKRHPPIRIAKGVYLTGITDHVTLMKQPIDVKTGYTEAFFQKLDESTQHTAQNWYATAFGKTHMEYIPYKFPSPAATSLDQAIRGPTIRRKAPTIAQLQKEYFDKILPTLQKHGFVDPLTVASLGKVKKTIHLPREEAKKRGIRSPGFGAITPDEEEIIRNATVAQDAAEQAVEMKNNSTIEAQVLVDRQKDKAGRETNTGFGVDGEKVKVIGDNPAAPSPELRRQEKRYRFRGHVYKTRAGYDNAWLKYNTGYQIRHWGADGYDTSGLAEAGREGSIAKHYDALDSLDYQKTERKQLEKQMRDEASVLHDAAAARAEYLAGLKQERRTVMGVMGRLGDTKGDWYDWPRWHEARASQWSGIKSAGHGILPGFIERAVGHLGDAYITGQMGQNWKLMGLQNAFQKGVVPMASGVFQMSQGLTARGAAKSFGLSTGGGIAAGSAFGPTGMIIGGAIGAAQGITQIIGQLGEARIQSKGFEIQSKLHLINAGVGLFKDIHGMIHRLIMAPLKLLGNTIKWSIPIFTGLVATIRGLTGSALRKTDQLVGTPNLTFTTNMNTPDGRKKGIYDYVWSRVADARVRLPDGTIQSMMEDLVRRQQGLMLGKMPLGDTGIVSAATLGHINTFFQKWQLGDKVGAYQHFNDVITSLRPHDTTADTLNRAGEAFGENMIQILEQIKLTNDRSITNVQQLVEKSGGGRLGQLANYWAEIYGNPNNYYDTVAEYDVMKNIQGFQQMQIANNWWNFAGRKMELWWIKFLERLEKKDFKGAGQVAAGGLASGISFIKNTILPTVGATIAALFGKEDENNPGTFKMPSLQDAWKSIREKLESILPLIIGMYTTAWVSIATTGYDIVSKLAVTIWEKFYWLFDELRYLHIDWDEIKKGNIFGAFTNKRPTGETVLNAVNKEIATVSKMVPRGAVPFGLTDPDARDVISTIKANGWAGGTGLDAFNSKTAAGWKGKVTYDAFRGGFVSSYADDGITTYEEIIAAAIVANTKDGVLDKRNTYRSIAEAIKRTYDEGGRVYGLPILPGGTAPGERRPADGTFIKGFKDWQDAIDQFDKLGAHEGKLGEFVEGLPEGRKKFKAYLLGAQPTANEVLLDLTKGLMDIIEKVLGNVDGLDGLFGPLKERVKGLMAWATNQGNAIQSDSIGRSNEYDLRTLSSMSGMLTRRNQPIKEAMAQ